MKDLQYSSFEVLSGVDHVDLIVYHDLGPGVKGLCP